MLIRTRTKSAEDTRELAGAIAQVTRPGDVLLLAGDLGAGKTTFVQGFARALGTSEPVTSPTFTLMRSYEGRLPVVHVDAYRLDQVQEVVDLGLYELLDEGGVALIEWGDVVAGAFASNFLEIRLEFDSDDDARVLCARPVGSGWARRASALQHALDRWTGDPP